MATWAHLTEMRGTYISPVYDIQTHFEAYHETFSNIYELNGGKVDIFVRISFDGTTWNEWININNASYDGLFRDDYYNLEYCKFQYKVVMVNNSGTSPVFQQFSVNLLGAYLVWNGGDVVSKPEIWITKRNVSGTIRLINETNGQVLELKDLNKDEEVYIDCENEDIVTSLPLRYRYSDHNNVFLEFEVGENLITGEGDFDCVMRFEFKTLQG